MCRGLPRNQETDAVTLACSSCGYAAPQGQEPAPYASQYDGLRYSSQRHEQSGVKPEPWGNIITR